MPSRHNMHSYGQQTGTQIDRDTDRQTTRQTDTQTDRHIDRQTDRHIDIPPSKMCCTFFVCQLRR